MIEEQDAICRQIMNELKKIPVWKLFSDSHVHQIPKSIAKPITFEIIESRLDHHVYPSSDSWVAEMRRLFMHEMENSSQNVLRKSAALVLSQRFEELMQTIAPGIAPHILTVQSVEQDLRTILDQIVSENPQTIQKSHKPQAEFFKNLSEENEITPELIIHKVQLMKFPDLILRVFAFVHKLQPECISYGQTLAVNFALFSQENLIKLNNYINKLMNEAASGKINPMRRTSMSSIIPIEVHSV